MSMIGTMTAVLLSFLLLAVGMGIYILVLLPVMQEILERLGVIDNYK